MPATSAHPQASLEDFRPTREFFVGIDSDGCVFDTMEVKHKECFIPNIVRTFGLAAVSRYVREVAEFLNLYSRWRGINRFPGLIQTLDLLADRPEVIRRGIEIPRLEGLRDWIGRESRLGNPALRDEVEATGDPDLRLALDWSLAVNRDVEATVRSVPPFAGVIESLGMLAGKADVMVVSATPGEALTREWGAHDLDRLVAQIAGQEFGGKREILTHAAAGRYDPTRILMIGDAPGDLQAAEAIGALFYPIEPGDEDASWRRFHEEALPRLFAGTYAGPYMTERIDAFEARLPETPPWGPGPPDRRPGGPRPIDTKGDPR